MRERVETFGDVALDEPDGSHPVVVDFPQCRMTSSSWSEPMGMRAELRLKVGVKNEAHDFLQQFIRPGLNAKRAFPTILFGNVDAPGRTPSVSFVLQCLDDVVDFVPGHAICGFLGCPFGHGPMVAINLPIGYEVEVWVVQEPIHAL